MSIDGLSRKHNNFLNNNVSAIKENKMTKLIVRIGTNLQTCTLNILFVGGTVSRPRSGGCRK